jgi:hypothetical protein
MDVRRLALATAAAALVVAAAAACGSSPATVRPASAPASTASALAGKSAAQIASTAVADTQAASSVRLMGAGTDTSKGVAFDLTLVRGQGCEGSLSMSKTDTFQLVYLGQTVWMKPSDAFYASLGSNKAALSLLEGKYITVKSTNSLVGNISQLCSLNDLLGPIGQASGSGYSDTLSTVQGQPAIRIAQPGHTGYAYVSDSANPVLLEVTAPGASGGSITFSDYNAPVRITAPPAAQTIDGSKLGL